MQKKTLKYRLFIICICSLGGFVFKAYPQIIVSIPQANIASKTSFTQSANFGEFSSVLNLLTTISINSNISPSFSLVTDNTITVPLSVANIKLSNIAGVNVLSTSTEVPLSVSNGTLYNAVLGVTNGAMNGDIRLVLAGQAWRAGDYSSGIKFTVGGVSLGSVTPATNTLTLRVPSFIATYAAPGAISLNVNSFQYFRDVAGISATSAATISHTEPFTPGIQASTSNFSFSSASQYKTVPVKAVNLVKVNLLNASSAIARQLSNTMQTLSSTAYTVPVGNSTILTAQFSIDGTTLKQNFLQAGSYAVPITYNYGTTTSASSLQVVVSDMAEITSTQQSVSLPISNASDYKNGKSVDVTGNLVVSKTTPFDVYVRAASGSFVAGGNTLPLNIMRIVALNDVFASPAVTLSTTATKILTSADPAVDRAVSIRYSIPAASMTSVIGKPIGNYTTSIIFSFSAP